MQLIIYVHKMKLILHLYLKKGKLHVIKFWNFSRSLHLGFMVLSVYFSIFRTFKIDAQSL